LLFIVTREEGGKKEEEVRRNFYSGEMVGAIIANTCSALNGS